MTAQPWLECERVEAWLGPRPMFRDLSLRLHPGEHTAILGPNGSGKSSLIRLLSRRIYPVVKPGSHLKLFGQETVNLWELRSRIGLLSQDLQETCPGSVALERLVLAGFAGLLVPGPGQRFSNGQRRRVAQLLEQLGLAALAQRPFAELSSGQQRRTLLARALVHEPAVLVLDEPLVGLDLAAAHQLLALLRDLARGGTTLLLVTHQIESIIPEISRCLLLREGQLIADGPSETLLRDGPLSALFGTPLRVCQANGYRQVLPG